MNLKHLSLAERQNYENMTVVPILSDTNTPFDVLDLKEGLKMGLVKIEECDNSNIEQVKFRALQDFVAIAKPCFIRY